ARGLYQIHRSSSFRMWMTDHNSSEFVFHARLPKGHDHSSINWPSLNLASPIWHIEAISAFAVSTSIVTNSMTVPLRITLS
ncbi:MAG: hypothetical protein J7L46_03895, partial [Bacteroidales bacterium]|nr:hypothetical protein [Bacteroidales bacterium]